MKPLNIHIIEDEPLIAETIKAVLENENHTITGISLRGKDAIFDIEYLKPDLVLVDIMIKGDMDGIEIVNHLRQKIDIPFIYLTSLSDEKTLERVKATNPSGFIVKPFNENTLTANIELAYHKYEASKSSIEVNTQSDAFFIKNKGELLKIVQSDILFFEAYDNYCNLYTSDKKHLLSHTLKRVEEKLPSSQFLKVHRSYIINFSKIDSIHDGYIFIEKHKIPYSKSHREQLMKKLNLF
ncbi:LytR/AlgR family response regulator transcription factor [Winogradskyella psychrotolerans]|uniref:LytR/AlgR family response regulator transcription factor n=1 Tax=Winogradskyella psychrotolerans TaxID=1344585 RepID=UPI001C0720B7|nr:LytTR family transcriptional regulator DNA-binding domain-containing protein [Winogradskyella psychrotolerans]MBU2926986.1 LytTR family transcriptional regulator DNA-binding domain-containing protein [Winogradskyella psychrotolerans]